MSRQMELSFDKEYYSSTGCALALFVKKKLHFCSARIDGICKSCLILLLWEACIFAFTCLFLSNDQKGTCLFIPQIRQWRIVIIFHRWPTISALEMIVKGWKHPHPFFGTESCALGYWQDLCYASPTNHQMGPRIKIPIFRLRAKNYTVIAACCLELCLIRN